MSAVDLFENAYSAYVASKINLDTHRCVNQTALAYLDCTTSLTASTAQLGAALESTLGPLHHQPGSYNLKHVGQSVLERASQDATLWDDHTIRDPQSFMHQTVPAGMASPALVTRACTPTGGAAFLSKARLG